MQIKQPLDITSRLLPGVEIGGATISIEYAHVTRDRRQAYRWFIDLPNGDKEFQSEDLCSGAGVGTLQEGLESLLGFLSAFAEACQYDDPSDFSQPEECLFPAGLAEWAVANADEFSVLECQLQEGPGEYIVE